MRYISELWDLSSQGLPNDTVSAHLQLRGPEKCYILWRYFVVCLVWHCNKPTFLSRLGEYRCTPGGLYIHKVLWDARQNKTLAEEGKNIVVV